jgi:hypothetical protein
MTQAMMTSALAIELMMIQSEMSSATAPFGFPLKISSIDAGMTIAPANAKVKMLKATTNF